MNYFLVFLSLIQWENNVEKADFLKAQIISFSDIFFLIFLSYLFYFYKLKLFFLVK